MKNSVNTMKIKLLGALFVCAIFSANCAKSQAQIIEVDLLSSYGLTAIKDVDKNGSDSFGFIRAMSFDQILFKNLYL